MEYLGINLQQAEELLGAHIRDPITRLHCVESQAIMKALAKHFGEDEEAWGIIGLLHDIDWDLTKNNNEEHCVQAVEILKSAGASEFFINAIISHGYSNPLIPAYLDRKRNSRLEYSLVSAETLTGLIIASALIKPEKKLSSLNVHSLEKKFKTLKFAANCNRELIKECEMAGIGLDEFLEIGLKALQEIADKIGL